MNCDEPLVHPVVPVFDPRDESALLAEIIARLPGFTPEWRVRPGEAGWALLNVYARYLRILGEGLNRLPERSVLAFLDLFGESLIPAQSSRVPLVFSLLPNSPASVELPARTTVAAKLPPPRPSFAAMDSAGASPPAPLFYTTQAVSLARAQLVCVRSIDPDADCYTDCSAGLQSGFTAFDDRAPVPHVLYLGHDKLFKLTGTAEVVLSVAFAETARPERTLVVDWEYLSQDGWLPLQVTEDATDRFTKDGEVTLVKCCGADSKQAAVNGRTSYWIRASVNLARPFANVTGTESLVIEVDSVTTWVKGDVIHVDGVVRAIVESVQGKLVSLEQAAHFDPHEVLDVSGKPSAIVVRAPVTTMLMNFTYPFLAGDRVTVNGEDSARVLRLRPGKLELEGSLADAQPGARLFLSVVPPPLRPEGLDALGPLPKLDVVFARPPFDDTLVAAAPIFHERIQAVIADDSPLALRQEVRIRDLANVPLLLWDRHMSPALYDRVLELYARHGMVAPMVPTPGAGPYNHAGLMMVASGKGVYLCLGVPLTSPQPASGVAVLPVVDPGATIEVCVASRKGEASPLVGQFLDCVWETYPQPRRVAALGA